MATPFSDEWKGAWEDIARGRRDNAELYPGALSRLQKFKKEYGLDVLKELANRKASPNFILCSLVKYLWCENVPEQKYKQGFFRGLSARLEAIKLVRQIVDDLRPPKVQLKTVLSLEPPSPEVEKWLVDAEKAFSFYQEYEDPSKKRRVQNNKENRTIFTLHEHIRQTTGTPNWRLCLNLLQKAGIFGPAAGDSDGVDRLIKSRIKTFETAYPHEAEAIRNQLIPRLKNEPSGCFSPFPS
jgi:hypothetical protein